MNQTTASSEEALFIEPSLAHPYAAELAQLYRSIADTLEFYASAEAPNHLNREARKMDITFTKLRLEELDRRCQEWLDNFLSERYD